MRWTRLALLCGILVTACSDETRMQTASRVAHPAEATASAMASRVGVARSGAAIASLPDRGTLVAYDTQQPRKRGASTWRAVHLSEAHALHAIGGEIRLEAPDGTPLRLQYERHVEHPDGNWTWIGRAAGQGRGAEVILTFGADAVFGEIRAAGEPLQVTTEGGRTWLVETDSNSVSAPRDATGDGVDALAPPLAALGFEEGGMGTPESAAVASADAEAQLAANIGAESSVASAAEMRTIDMVLGYTSGFAERLGGQSQAVTRLTFMVDVANQALGNSEVDGQFRIARTLQVDYPDATSNRSALFALTGVQCTSTIGGQLPDGGVSCQQTGQPAALAPLINARERYHADVVVLVRKLEYPENQSCGLGWMLGGGRKPITASSANFAMSVVSDSSGTLYPDEGNTCRHETLAHEVGHNLGLQHDRMTAQGSDDTNDDGDLLDPEEYGSRSYSFGYTSEAGNFYTVMTPRRAGQVGYRVFSNPRIDFCGGALCGDAETDNARALEGNIPVIAAFRYPVTMVSGYGDLNGDGRSDLLWRGLQPTSNFVMWFMNGASHATRSSMLSPSYDVVATGDFNGDKRLDVIWREGTSTRLRMWLGSGAGTFTGYWLESTFGAGWEVVGAGDVDGDGKSDLLWRGNTATNNFVIWFMDGASGFQARANTLSPTYRVVGLGDFNGDRKLDVAWRSGSSTRLRLWMGSGSGSFTGYWLESTFGTGWDVVGAGDVNGDGKSDLLWRGSGATGNFVMWQMDGPTRKATRTTTLSPSYRVATIGDFNGDHRMDVVWRAGSATQVRLWLGSGTGSFTGYWLESGRGAGWELVP